MARPISFNGAALGGFLYAALMCAWIYYDRAATFDELAIRFAVYFIGFTLGLYYIYNWIVTRAFNRDL